jgi:hypothetical protein
MKKVVVIMLCIILKPEDMHLLATDPGKVRANAYDMEMEMKLEVLFVFS